MGTFLPILTPVLPPLAPKTRKIWVIYQSLLSTHLTYLSCDICPKNDIHTVIYREIGTCLLFWSPFFSNILGLQMGSFTNGLCAEPFSSF